MSAAPRTVLVAFLALGTPVLAECELGGATAADGGQQVLTLADAASFLQMEESVLATAAQDGEVPGRRLAGEWRFARAALVAWLAGSDEPGECFDVQQTAGVEVLAASVTTENAAPSHADASPSPLLPSELGVVVGRGRASLGLGATGTVAPPAPPLTPSGPAPGSPSTSPDGPAGQTIVGDAPEQGSARDVALRRQIVLTPQGGFTVETDLRFGRQDQDLSSLGPTGIVIASRRAQSLSATLIGRYGLRDDLQLSFGIPWVRRDEEITASFSGTPTILFDSSERRLDDAWVSLRYAVSAEGPARPSVVVSVDGRIPLDGSDAYALGAGVSLVKNIDPAALFASFSYLHTFNAGSRGADRLVPDDSFSLAAGFAFALNDSLSFSTALNSTFNSESGTGRVSLQSNQSYDLRLALTSLINEKIYVEPSVSMRLNGPNDAVTFGLHLSYSVED